MRDEYHFEREGCWISECWNTADDDAVSIARVRVAPRSSTRWHQLTNTLERYVMLTGHGRVEVGTEAPREVGPGDVVLIPANTPQRIANLGDGELVFLAVCTPRFRPEAYQQLDVANE